MQTFLVVFIGTEEALETSRWTALTETQRQERMQSGLSAWHAWMRANHRHVVAAGGPIGKAKRVTAAGIGDVKTTIAGYVVVAAESHDAAARLFEGHPHVSIFPGEAIEVMECLPAPSV